MSLRLALLITFVVPLWVAQALALEPCGEREFLDGVHVPLYARAPTRPITYRPARVIGSPGAEVYLYDGGKDCPTGLCRRDDFLAPGDELVVSHVSGGWACVFHIAPDMDKNGRSAKQNIGWIAANSLDIGEPTRTPLLRDWFGKWSYRTKWVDENANIELRAGKVPGTLAATGDALGYGGNVPHTGSLEAFAVPKGNKIIFKEKAGCRVYVVLVGDRLIAGDNLKCGGLNVTFGGVYHRVEP